MKFAYKVYKDGKVVKGKIESDNKEKVIEYLKQKNFIIITIQKQEYELHFTPKINHISFNDIVDFTRQLAIMLNAGLTIVDSIEILKKQVSKSEMLQLLNEISSEIKAGNSFSYTLRKFPHYFSNLYISLIKAGEASGKLDDILLKLADNLEKQRDLRGKLKSALIYPAIIFVGMLGVMFIMITFVIPKLLDLYKDFNVDLPLSTKILIAVSGFFQAFWPVIIIACVGTYVGTKKYFKTNAGKKVYDETVLKLPVFGNVIKVSELVDVTRTLSILIGSGVSILDALSIIVETSPNTVYQKAFKDIYTKIEKGQSLGKSLEEAHLFPPILVQMATVGEQTGHLDDTLLRLSRYFESESEIALKTMTTLIEPVVLVILGVGVGVLVMSVLTPIYNLTSSFK